MSFSLFYESSQKLLLIDSIFQSFLSSQSYLSFLPYFLFSATVKFFVLLTCYIHKQQLTNTCTLYTPTTSDEQYKKLNTHNFPFLCTEKNFHPITRSDGMYSKNRYLMRQLKEKYTELWKLLPTGKIFSYWLQPARGEVYLTNSVLYFLSPPPPPLECHAHLMTWYAILSRSLRLRLERKRTPSHSKDIKICQLALLFHIEVHTCSF